MNSPIRYYGSKTYDVDIIKSYFPSSFDVYVEGFGGGASLLFSKEPNCAEVYNDLDKNVYSVFKCLQDEDLYKKLKFKLELTYYSKDIWLEFKNDLKYKDLSILERAYKYIYVNRTSFNSNGGFSVSTKLRRNMSKVTSAYLSTIEGLEDVHNRLSTVIIENKDIFEIFEENDDTNVFFYLDPPYLFSTRKCKSGYNKEMTDEQHEKMLRKIITMKSKIMISGYDSDLYNNYLKDWNKITFESPNTGSNEIEVLWINYNLNEDMFDL